ncbi:MAG: BMP family ABC transporter substrate-binding protein [Clostridia bacterium]|nr:BMP family ABC transporter substrate-binding protein [Clostridia bacterium]
MKRVYITTFLTALLLLAVFSGVLTAWDGSHRVDTLKVGFIYKNDESTPYTYNFMLAQEALEREYPGRVQVYTRSNVPDEETMEPLRELVRAGCAVIFTNNNSSDLIEAAREYPDVEFCQGAFAAGEGVQTPENYHTFYSAIYEGRYATGVVAGLKLRDLIDAKVIAPDEALVGYLGSFANPDVISGYTAFLLGVRSVAPEAVMRVRYTGTWNSYSREKAGAAQLIEEGCVIIAHHTDTIGPAVACEEAAASKRVFHVGYHESMTDIAPSTSLLSARTNWAVYVIGAVEALLEGGQIERHVPGQAQGNGMWAGFDHGWVELTELNRQIAPEGTQEKLDQVIDALRKGHIDVFRGDYIGVDPQDPSDTVDLSSGYRENADSPWPSFHWVLKDVITVEE